MIEKNLVVGPFQCNCRLLACPRTGEALLIDPGDEAERLVREIGAARLPDGRPISVRYLLHTHAHLDHVGATRAVRERESGARIALHRQDEPLYLGLKMQGRLFGIEYDDPLPVDHFLEDGERLQVGDLRLEVLHTPGHSPGSVCFRLSEDSSAGARETVFSGDTLFRGSVGRTDLWGGDSDMLFRSIRERLLGLDDDIRVCPGHGPDSSIGLERRDNPFLT